MRLIKTAHPTRLVGGVIHTSDFDPPTLEAEVMFVEWKEIDGKAVAVITWKVPRVLGKTKAELEAQRRR